jgi:cation transport ATPase
MKNLSCASCAAKIEKRTSHLSYVNSASYNFANQILMVDFKEGYNELKAVKDIKEIVDALEDNIETYYYETKPIEHKTVFIKEYFFVLLGFLIIMVNFGFYRIPTYFRLTTDPFVGTPWVIGLMYWIGYVLLISRILVRQLKSIRSFAFFNENVDDYCNFLRDVAGKTRRKHRRYPFVLLWRTSSKQSCPKIKKRNIGFNGHQSRLC